jgi:cell wall assembly regulator SMI1
MTPLLDNDVLARLEQELDTQGAPLTTHLRQGVDEHEARRIVSNLGLRLPVEAQRWFAWHDGVGQAEWPPEASLAGTTLLELADAVQGYQERRETALSNAPNPQLAETEWNSSWLPIAVLFGGRDLAIDCAAPADGPVPVYLVDWWAGPDVASVPACSSMRALVELWIGALEQQIWRWNGEERSWEIDGERAGDSRAGELLRG